jgi:hypothetical protein
MVEDGLGEYKLGAVSAVHSCIRVSYFKHDRERHGVCGVFPKICNVNVNLYASVSYLVKPESTLVMLASPNDRRKTY